MTEGRSLTRVVSPLPIILRGVQLKILLLLCLFMGVLALMAYAGRPATWEWMWKLQGPPSSQTSTSRQPPSTPASQAEAAGKSPLSASEPLNRSGHTATDEFPSEPLVTSAPRLRAGEPDDSSLSADVRTAQLDGWNHVLGQLSPAQRELLRRGMWKRRHDQLLDSDDQAQWPTLMQQLTSNWHNYYAQAAQMITEDNGQLTERQKRLSQEIVETSKSLWKQRAAALSAAGRPQALTVDQVADLADLQALFDRRDFSQIEDNTVLRSAETAAWYRCWEKLAGLSSQELNQAVGPLTYVQLFSQPNEFRGQLVKITGTARWGYRVKSRAARFGIDSYVVLGILPGRGTSSPIVVYCVGLPAGFPKVQSGNSADGGSQLDEDIQITGYFFKRWLHASGEGMTLSPLILGRVTQWHPPNKSAQTTKLARLSPSMIVLAVCGMALVGTCIAVWVYRSSRISSREITTWTHPPAALPTFDPSGVQGGVTESLRALAQDDRNDGS